MLEGSAAASTGTSTSRPRAVVLGLADVGLLAHLPGCAGRVREHLDGAAAAVVHTNDRCQRVWDDLGWTGEGIGIAVIDTGIDGTHPDLCAAEEFCQGTPSRRSQRQDPGPTDVLEEPVVVLEGLVNTDTSSGHGTHVAGIAGGAGVGSLVGADYRGVAPGANLIGLSTGEAIEAVNVLAAYDWVIEHAEAYNIRAINNSWGPGKGTPYDPGHPVNLASDAAHAAGISVVFGAGNDGPTTDSLNMFSVHDTALSVAGGINTGHIAFFSSRGVPGSDRWQPTITAPGYMIAAARSSTGFYSALAGVLGPSPDQVARGRGALRDQQRHLDGRPARRWRGRPDAAGRLRIPRRPPPQTRSGPSCSTPPCDRTATAVRVACPTTRRTRWVRATSMRLPRWRPQLRRDRTRPRGTRARSRRCRPSTAPPGPAVLIPTTTFDDTIEVQDGAISLDVMAEWAWRPTTSTWTCSGPTARWPCRPSCAVTRTASPTATRRSAARSPTSASPWSPRSPAPGEWSFVVVWPAPSRT
jgi:hypothetical protein